MRSFGLGWIILAAGLALAGAAAAAPDAVTIPGDHVFPESFAAAPDGSLYVGSTGEGAIFRVPPGGRTARPFVKPGPALMSIMGVLADAPRGLLYACTNDWSAHGVAAVGKGGPPALLVFNLATGALRGRYPFPGGTGFCNDIAVGRDGAAYVTDSGRPRILRLRPGAAALETWLEDPVFGTTGFNLDGIAFGRDGALYLTGFSKGELFRVAVEAGMKPGRVTRLALSRPVRFPDGMRPLRGGRGTAFLLAEGGRLDRVDIADGRAAITVLSADVPGAVSAAQIGRTAWVLEGQLGFLFDPSLRGRKPAPFRAVAVPLPAE